MCPQYDLSCLLNSFSLCVRSNFAKLLYMQYKKSLIWFKDYQEYLKKYTTFLLFNKLCRIKAHKNFLLFFPSILFYRGQLQQWQHR